MNCSVLVCLYRTVSFVYSFHGTTIPKLCQDFPASNFKEKNSQIINDDIF
jgi:hypothetical protein